MIRMKWAGYMVRISLIERREIIEKILDKEARKLQKTRKNTAKIGGLCEERSEKGKGGGQLEREGQQQGPMENI